MWGIYEKAVSLGHSWEYTNYYEACIGPHIRGPSPPRPRRAARVLDCCPAAPQRACEPRWSAEWWSGGGRAGRAVFAASDLGIRSLDRSLQHWTGWEGKVRKISWLGVSTYLDAVHGGSTDMITTLARPAYNAIAAAWPGSTLRSPLGGRDASSTDSCRIILRTAQGRERCINQLMCIVGAWASRY